MTDPRQPVDKKFKDKFISWAQGKDLYISTGSDFSKTKEQVPKDMLECFKLIYCCMGNEVRTPIGTVIKSGVFKLPRQLNEDLLEYLEDSPFHYRTGNHMEYRPGMMNFSVVGRNADQEQRKEYEMWDKENNERSQLALYINQDYPELEATVGGSISIDIIRKGYDKGQIVQKLISMGYDEIEFFGDRCFPGGNDYGIVRELRKTKKIKWKSTNVLGPNETLNYILPI